MEQGILSAGPPVLERCRQGLAQPRIFVEIGLAEASCPPAKLATSSLAREDHRNAGTVRIPCSPAPRRTHGLDGWKFRCAQARQSVFQAHRTTPPRDTMATQITPRLPSPDAMMIAPAKWPVCSRCQLPVAQFSLSDRLRCDLLKLLEKGQVNDAVRLLRSVAGCTPACARSWVAHHGLACFRNPLCPLCQRPLRTPSARQCRYCGSDWHRSVTAAGSIPA